VNREITDISEKAKALLVYFMQKDLPFRIETGKVIVKCLKQEAQLLAILKPKMKEILSLDIETEVEPEAKQPSNGNNLPAGNS
jgi:hypothetical protein